MSDELTHTLRIGDSLNIKKPDEFVIGKASELSSGDALRYLNNLSHQIEIEKLRQRAKEFANSSPKIKDDCPRDVVNPGLYFGYLAGARAERELK